MKIRTECPRKNKYYIRTVTGGLNGAVAGNPTQPYANVLDNCVGYANGRFNEVWNDPNLEGIIKPFHVQLVCNAENFIESAKRQGLKISSTPVVGGIMVWQKGRTLSDNDGAGHVAFVERVYDDGTILTSESGWKSWAFKTVRRDNSNGRWGQNSLYKFRGCIINPEVKNEITPAPKLDVDGIGGTCTVRAMQRFFSTPQDGVLSGQNKTQSKYYPALKAVEYGKGGSPCVKNLQKWVDTTQDGNIGEQTVKAWQKKIGVACDGIFGANSMRAWQEYLNEHDKAVYPTPSVDYYKVIDVSDWQGQIDWAKVKADGIVGAIIRYADGNTLDKRFAENMKNAKAAGLHIGSYIFSRAKNIAEAEAEATRLLNACKPYAPDMPLYIDLEVASLAKYANVVAQAFLVKMKALGGKGGVYANLNWWNNHLVDTAKNYSSNPFWIAQYNTTMDYKPSDRMGMWQYTSEGRVNGIDGDVCMDKCYRAYWENPTIVERELEACKVQADWMKDAKYEYEKNPTVPKSKYKGTCVTYESCVLQRIGLIPSGQSLWHDENGKVYGANSNFTVIYPKNKTLSQLKNELKAGDIVMDGSGVGSGSHVFILTGKWNGSKPVIWDNWSGQKSKGAYTYDRDRHVIAIVRPK